MENTTSNTPRRNTIFKKTTPTTIDNVHVGDVVYIKVKSPLNYGIREWEFYGRITKITACFFWIAEYCDGHSWGGGDCTCDTERRKKVNTIPEFRNRCTRKWKKTSLSEIWISNS